MSSNCLQTKLKSIVNNNNLKVLNAFELYNKAVMETPKCGNNVIRLVSDEEITVESKDGANCIQWASSYTASEDIPSSGYTNKVTLPAILGGYVCIANVDCELIVKNKYAIDTIMHLSGTSYNKNYGFKDISQLDYCAKLGSLFCANIKGEGVLSFKVDSPLSLINLNQFNTSSDVAVNIETIPVNNYTEISLTGTKSFGDVATFIRRLTNGGKWVSGNIYFLNTNITGTAETIIMALKEANIYEQTMSLTSNVTLKGEKFLLEGNRMFKSIDGGVTYDVIKVSDSSVINTYNTVTNTWAN